MLWNRQLTECAAMLIIGDSVLALIDPGRHAALWNCGPKSWKAVVRPFIKNPNLTRCVGAAGLFVGIWLAERQQPVRRNP